MGPAWCQSKHVRLITKCYPPRTANPPKPNSSELSYLTYYAYTTPSKLKKVGRYLEHRAQTGLTKGRTGDVTVTLDICTALIKKCFRDLGLFASNIVVILTAVVKDGELVLIEHSVLTLKAFCSHHDGKLLTISREFRANFHALCKAYAQYGVNQDDMRAQYASLDALSAFISSDAFHTTTAGGQLKIIVPALVQILANSTVPLQTLQSKISEERLSPFERRQSFFSRDASVSQAPGTPRSSIQVDFTEQENSTLALKNLKHVCEMNNASLIRLGLDYLMDKLASLTSSGSTDDYPAWAVELVTLVLTWLPIQHRYLCVSASLEDLDGAGTKRYQDKAISTPKQQLILTILEGILTTGESLIGLNVMDVLNLLIDKIAIQISLRPTTKIDVIQKLLNCIVGLAGHVYYTDQIRDMCSSIMEWSRPLLRSLHPTVSGKDSPATEGEEDVQDVKIAAVWSLRILKGVLSKGGGSVGLEEVWRGTEGGLSGRDGEVRMAYVDALTTHIRAEQKGLGGGGETEDPDVAGLARFLGMIHVPVYVTLKATDASASDYWAVWVLLLVLLTRFEVKEVIKVLPMKWRLLDVTRDKCSRERIACVEAIFLGFLAIVSDSFKIPDLENTVSKEIDIRKTLDEWPSFIDPVTNPAKITLHDISSTSLVLPCPTESPRPLPAELQRTILVNTLAFCKAFPENLREHLLVQWTEETTMPEQLSFTPDSLSGRLHESHHAESLSTRSRSVEDTHHHLLHPRQKSLSRHLERSPSPATNIAQLRRVLAGGNRNSIVGDTTGVPQIEINGEKIVTPSRESVDTPNEKASVEDVNDILKSLNVNGEWNEKTTSMEHPNGKVESGIKPPYSGI